MVRSRLFLLDGMALAYRAHFAFINSNLQNSEGIPTGPILGFANTLERLLITEQPSHIAVAWDLHGPTFRHEKDDTYKANRPPQPDDLRRSIPLIKDMISYWGIQNLGLAGFEADDVIGTVAYQAAGESVDVYMVTPDKDFMQLVTDHVFMYKPLNREFGFQTVDREGVKEFFGVYPEKVIDVLAIIGDVSDNVPGVKGIGKKGAPNLINKYGSLEETLKAAPKIKSPKISEALQRDADQAIRAKDMVTIHTAVPETPNWADFVWEQPNSHKLGAFFERMGFRQLTKKYLSDFVVEGEDSMPKKATKDAESSTESSSDSKKEESKEVTQTDLFGSATSTSAAAHKINDEPWAFKGTAYQEDEVDYQIITDETALTALVNELEKAPYFCFDTETQGSDPLVAEIVGLSFCLQAGKAYYIPVWKDQALAKKQVLDVLKPIFSRKDVLVIAHNLKFDLQILHKEGVKIAGKIFDTLVAAYLIDADQQLKMDALAEKYLGYTPMPISSLFEEKLKKKDLLDMANVALDKMRIYAAEDADVTLRLFHCFKALIEKDELNYMADSIEFPLIPVLTDMEETGIELDVDMLSDFSVVLTNDLQQISARIFEQAAEEFNLNSPKQLGVILFEKLELKPNGKIKKTKTGQYSTNEQVLSDLAVKYDIAADILTFRTLGKLLSTYVDALPKLVYDHDGRLHTSFNQAVANTGRLSSSAPNLQNIPIRTERGREMRKAFIAKKDHVLLAADYSQVELRIIAAISEDENMIAAFNNGEDIHARTAKEIFHLDSLDEVTSDHRRKAKEVNFGIPYGVSAFGLAQRLGIPNAEGKEMIDRYFARFPKVKEYMTNQVIFAKEHGYVKTLFGRKRYLPDINAGGMARGFAERNAINMPIQGTAADIIKLAMADIYAWLQASDFRTKMVLQVHDELIFEVPEDELEQVQPEILKRMEAIDIGVPLKVESGSGVNWLEAH